MDWKEYRRIDAVYSFHLIYLHISHHFYIHIVGQINMNESQYIPLEYTETLHVRIAGKGGLGKRNYFSILYSPVKFLV